MMPTPKTKINKFDGTVIELEKNLGLHDGIQAHLQLERNGNSLVHVPFGCREGRHFQIRGPNSRYYGHSQRVLTSIANEVEAERGLGNAKLIPSPTDNVSGRGAILPQRSGRQ